MARAESSTDRRDRGRPQLRPDDETRQIIYEAARHEFAAAGFAATSTETVARRAGVSTKTLYRLVPNKAALFEGMLIGMVASAPQRAAIFGGVPLPSRAHIRARVRKCVTLFLRGCEAKGRAR